jgi:membrane protease subunit HflC
MRRPVRLLIAGVIVLFVAAVLLASMFVVDETEFAVVMEFGRVIDVLGDEPDETGLHLKRPWLSVVKVDRRLRVFDAPGREVITGDKKNLDVSSFVLWQVADPLAFLQGSGTPDQAEARLGERVAAAVSDAIGRVELAALASTEPGRWKLDELTTQIQQAVAPLARTELGVDLLDVRLRRFQHPLEVRPAVFELIRSERRQVAARLRAEGEAEHQTITSRADRERETRIAQAEAEADRIRGKAEAEATRLLNEAHAIDPKFYEFLRVLESYKSILDAQTTIVLSSSSPLLKLLTAGPPEGDSPSPSPRRDSSTGEASTRTAERQEKRP